MSIILNDTSRKPPRAQLPPINNNIKADRVQVIGQDGGNLGVLPLHEAISIARAAELDLVLIAPTGKDDVPVTKIMDYGKLLYEKKKKQTEAKKHQKTIQVKEVKVRPKIGEHDFLTKIKQAAGFLKEGKHVKMTLQFRGREMTTRQERGTEMFDRIEQLFKELEIGNFAHEKEAKQGPFWSRVYFVKSK